MLRESWELEDKNTKMGRRHNKTLPCCRAVRSSTRTCVGSPDLKEIDRLMGFEAWNYFMFMVPCIADLY